MTEPVLEALRAMRPPFTLYEADLHRMVGERLLECGFIYRHEAPLTQGCRIDYLVGDVGIEIKKGKPSPSGLTRQLARYAGCEKVRCLVVLTWRTVELPAVIDNKPVYPLALAQLWGVSLP